MVKVKQTYGKLKNKRPKITIVNNYNFITNVTNNYFNKSKSCSSEDEFDKLLKGSTNSEVIHSTPASSSVFKRKYFPDRQETFTSYNSDVTSESISSVHLFKDSWKDSRDAYSLSLPSPPDYTQVKNKLVKVTIKQKQNGRITKKKHKKTVQKVYSKMESKMLIAVSSTPTNPHLCPSKDKWLVSPIDLQESPYKNNPSNDSDRDMFDDEKKEENQSDAKQHSTHGMTALLEGFGNLGLATPHPKVKKGDESKTKNELLNNSEPVQLRSVSKNINTRSSRRITRATKNAQFAMEEFNKVKEESDIMGEQESRLKQTEVTNYLAEKQVEVVQNFVNSENTSISESVALPEKIEAVSNVEDVINSRLHSYNRTLRKKGTAKKQQFIEDLDQEKEGSNIADKITPCKQTDVREEVSCPIDSNSVNPSAIPDPTERLVDCQNEESNKTNMNTSEFLNSQTDRLRKCSAAQPDFKISLTPGKRWRRSFIRLKQPDSKKTTMGPALLMKLIREANLDKTNRSVLCSTINNNEGVVNNGPEMLINSFITSEILKIVSTRDKRKYDKVSLNQNFAHEMNNIPEESLCVAGKSTAVETLERDQSILTSRTELFSPKPNVSLMERSVMDLIPEESECEDGVRDVKNSRTEVSELSSIREEIKLTSITDTPPILRDTEVLSAITTRKKTRRKLKQSYSVVGTPQGGFDDAGGQLSFFKEFPRLSSLSRESDVADRQLSFGSSAGGSGDGSLQHSSFKAIPCLSSSSSESDTGDKHLSFNDSSENELQEGCLDEGELQQMGEMGVLSRCGQVGPLAFSEAYPDEVLSTCRKIGEGVYGEVFMVNRRGKEKSVVKIIAVEGSQIVNNAPQKKFDEVLSELIIAEELSLLRERTENRTSGFCELKKKFCLQGQYPPLLIDIWKKFDNEKHSENDCPDMFRSDQLYIVLELAHAGEAVESYRFGSAREAYSVFMQTTFSLAAAELNLEFEHRDLHIGNILVKKTSDDYLPFILDNVAFKFPTYGIQATIIDFTLSRISFKEDVLFFDLAKDPELFTAEGDYQFEIYRLMQKDLGNEWDCYAPVTNIRWLHYLVDKFITSVRYRKVKKARNKVHEEYLKKLAYIKDIMVDFKSSSDLAEFFLESFTETSTIVIDKTDL